MTYFILRRLGQAVITVFSVMLLTFILFRLIAGDVTAEFVNPKLGKPDRVSWLHKRKLDLPLDLNFRARIVLRDQTDGNGTFAVEKGAERYDSVLSVPAALLLEPVAKEGKDQTGPGQVVRIESAGVQWMDRDTLLASVAATDTRSAIAAAFDEPNALVPQAERWGPKRRFTPPSPAKTTTQPTTAPATQPATAPAAEPILPSEPFRPRIRIDFANNTSMVVDLTPLAAEGDRGQIGPNATVGDFIELLNEHPDNNGRLQAGISDIEYGWNIFNSQFFWHLWHSVTFENRSYKTEQRLIDIIAERAVYSLALTVPALALGWLTAMVVSSVVAYYRGGLIDKTGVFLSVLGMCVPYLVYMIAGQAILFQIAPSRAYGVVGTPANIFIPIVIAVIAGLGGKVRFYRTVILDEVHRDYVRTARAKGVPLPGILFRHVMKNCMLPILTSLVVSIPFLIMGSLLLERFFGIPGLGSLMVNSVSDRDVPMITGLTFLTSVVYVISLLLTDILYAVFDPRVRLR